MSNADDDDDSVQTLALGDQDEPLATPEERGDFLDVTPPVTHPGAADPLAMDDESGAIPKARFDQERVRRMMAEAELERLQEQLAQPQRAEACCADSACT